jgi:hypothetical protein
MWVVQGFHSIGRLGHDVLAGPTNVYKCMLLAGA